MPSTVLRIGCAMLRRNQGCQPIYGEGGNSLDEDDDDPERPTIVCIEQFDPLVGAGYWVPEMIDAAGGISAIVNSCEPPKQFTLDDLRTADSRCDCVST